MCLKEGYCTQAGLNFLAVISLFYNRLSVERICLPFPRDTGNDLCNEKKYATYGQANIFYDFTCRTAAAGLW